MLEKNHIPPNPLGRQVLFRLLLIGVFMFSTLTPVYAQAEFINVHPAILALAEENPNETIRVIIQENTRDGIARQALTQAGGQLLSELPMINGTVAELPARTVLELAQARSVRWITLDAPVIPASTTGNRCNLLLNPSFEDGFTKWDDWDGTLQRQLSGQSYTGAFSAYLGYNTGTLSQDLSNIKAGTTYTAGAMIRRPSGAANAWMSFGITFIDSNWRALKNVEVEIPESTTYVPLTASGTAPSGTRYMSVWIWKDKGGSLYVDNLSVQTSAMATGTCSGFEPTGGVNLLQNADFEAGTANWSLYHNAVTVTNDAYGGSKAILLGQSSGSIAQAEGTAFPGVVYTAKGMFHRPPGSPWTGIGIDFFDANWNQLDLDDSDDFATIPESSSYIPTTISRVAPAGTAHVSVWIYKNAGGVLTLDDISLTAGSVPDAYAQSVGADLLWFAKQPRDGAGVTVAVVDSGIADHADLATATGAATRVVQAVDLTNAGSNNDTYGHGTHVAGIIGGNGALSNGIHRGIAPGANLVNVRISNGQGMTYASDLIAGLQWIYDHRATDNIRVVNLSLNSTIVESYHVSPIDAAVELLWFNGITVVTAVGNNGSATGPVTIYPPANDPFVITVGATSDHNTPSLQDDTLENFSAYGTTLEGYAKPDLVAPGRNIISLSAGSKSNAVNDHPSHKVDNNYFRMSGTSMAAPVVSGVVALLLQDEPTLTPDQIKYRLQTTAVTDWVGYDAARAGAGYVNADAAINGNSTASANTGVAMSQLLNSTANAIAWDSVSWNSVSWNSVSWNSVSWNSVSWNSVSWNSVNWSSIWDDWGVTTWSTDSAPSSLKIAPPLTFDDLADQGLLDHLYLPLVSQ